VQIPETAGSEFAAGPAHALFSISSLQVDPYHQGFSVTPDDRAFIMLRGDSATDSPGSLTIVLHWLDEARRLIAHPGQEPRPQ
jgi:hypothetical protein